MKNVENMLWFFCLYLFYLIKIFALVLDLIYFQLENGKVAQSWTASDCRNLNAPAIFDSSSSAYHCVMNGKVAMPSRL